MEGPDLIGARFSRDTPEAIISEEKQEKGFRRGSDRGEVRRGVQFWGETRTHLEQGVSNVGV